MFLILIPSVAVVFAPPAYRDELPPLVSASFLGAWLLLSFPSYHERIRAVIDLLYRATISSGVDC